MTETGRCVEPGSEALPVAAVHALSRAMRTLRSTRRFLTAEVSPEKIEFVLEHAVRAGSAKNRQPWRFVVVRDARALSALVAWYRTAWRELAVLVREHAGAPSVTGEARVQMREAERLSRYFDTAPVVIVACFVPSRTNPADFYGGASIYPAVQNLLLAARAVGLGGTLTTLQAMDELPFPARAGQDRTVTGELREICGIPAEVVPAAVIPLGWPAEPFTAARRKPARAVTWADRWGEPWPSR